MADKLILYDTFECAGGIPLTVIGPIASGTARRVTDNSDSLVVTVPDWAGCVGRVQFGQVTRWEDPLGNVTEWRVSQIDDAVGEGEGTTTITAEHAITLLADVALIGDVTSGGGTAFNLGSARGIRPAEYLTAFVIPALEAVGITWVGVGTIEFTDPLIKTFERATPLQLVQDIATELACEVDFRRNGSSGYLLDLVAARNGSLSPVLAKKGKNLRRLSRSRRAVDLKTVFVPAGKVADGAVEAATIGRIVGKVTAKSGNTITIADPAGVASLIAFDDQWNGRYVLAADLSLVSITDTLLATQQLVLSDATLVAVGDHIEIRANSAGTLLTEFANPAAVAKNGRRVGTKANDKLRGERNQIRGAFLADWPTATTAVMGTPASSFDLSAKGTHTINVISFPANHAFAVGDRVTFGTDRRWARVSTASTLDASGAGALTFDAEVGYGVVGSSTALLHLTGQEAGPTGWDRAQMVANVGYLATGRIPVGSAAVQVTGTVSAVTMLNGRSKVTLSGLTASIPILVASLVEFNNAGAWLPVSFVAGETASDASGAATILLLDALFGFTPAVGQSWRITPPSLPDNTTGNLLVFHYASTSGIPLETEPFSVKADPSLTSVWISVGFSWARCVSSAAGNTDAAAVLSLLASDGTVLATATDAAETFDGFTWQHRTFRLQYTMLSDTDLVDARLQFTPPVAASPYLCALRWGSVFLTSDQECPPVEGAHANKLLGWGQTQLRTLSADPALYEMDLRDVATEEGYDADAESLLLGRPVRAHDAPRALDDTRRIVAITEDLTGEQEPKLEVSARAPSIAQVVSAQKPKPVFVQVNVTETSGSAPVVRTVKSTDSPPPETPDAKRAEQTPEGDVVVTTYNPTGFVI